MSEHDLGDDTPQRPRWLRATLDDVVNVTFEKPIQDANIDCFGLSRLYQEAATPADIEDKQGDTPEVRVFMLIAAITGMHFKPNEPNEPFGPMLTLPDGSQSPAPSDFVSVVDVIASLADRTKNISLRARLSDVAWLLDRKLIKQGVAAIGAYASIVCAASEGSKGSTLSYKNKDYLRRALQISRAIGWEKPEVIALRELLHSLRAEVAAGGNLVPIYWICELDLDFYVSDPAQIGIEIDSAITRFGSTQDPHLQVQLYRLAARAFRKAKKEDDKNRCLGEAAERFVIEANNNDHSALLAAHHLSEAIAQLHGVPGKRERRRELRHRLVDVQARIPDEMSVISKSIDLQEIVDQVEETIGTCNLLDKFFVFANLTSSRDPQKLRETAEENIRKHPLSSLFEPTHVDRHGKTISRGGGGGGFGKPSEGAINDHIVQEEARWRQIVVSAKIEVARQAIIERHFVSEDLVGSFLRHSPFVSSDQLHTFSKAFARFFQGDFVCAIYILTPLLEGLIRYVLILNGHEVTIFDDATRTQKDRTISSFFEQMRDEVETIFTKSIAQEMERLFLAKPGPHVRHKVSHALLDDWDPYGADAIYACWFIFRLCMLPLFRHQSRLNLEFAGTQLAEV